MNASQIRDIWKQTRADPTLQNTIQLSEILHSSENESSDFVLHKTIIDIERDIYDAISFLSRDAIRDTCLKLRGYRLVDEIYQIHKGKHTRWIRTDQPPYALANGGIVTDVKFTDKGVVIQFKMYGGRFMNQPFDKCIFFQKMSNDEELALHFMNAVAYDV